MSIMSKLYGHLSKRSIGIVLMPLPIVEKEMLWWG